MAFIITYADPNELIFSSTSRANRFNAAALTVSFRNALNQAIANGPVDTIAFRRRNAVEDLTLAGTLTTIPALAEGATTLLLPGVTDITSDTTAATAGSILFRLDDADGNTGFNPFPAPIIVDIQIGDTPTRFTIPAPSSNYPTGLPGLQRFRDLIRSQAEIREGIADNFVITNVGTNNVNLLFTAIQRGSHDPLRGLIRVDSNPGVNYTGVVTQGQDPEETPFDIAQFRGNGRLLGEFRPPLLRSAGRLKGDKPKREEMREIGNPVMGSRYGPNLSYRNG